jgi:hypothetical protein
MANKQLSEMISSFSSSIGDIHISKFGESLWTVDEVAEYLKLQPETIRSMARRGATGDRLGKVGDSTKLPSMSCW